MLKKILDFGRYIRQQHIFWLMLITLCVLLQWFDLATSLRYDKNLIIEGELHRVVSAHFVHLNTAHLLMNMSGIFIILVFFSTHLKILQWLTLILFSSLFISAGLFLFNTDIQFYVGMSGILHGLFIVGAILEIRHLPVSGWLLLSIIVLKLIWEQFNGAIMGSESIIGGLVLVDSHLYGAISGLFFITFLALRKNLLASLSAKCSQKI